MEHSTSRILIVSIRYQRSISVNISMSMSALLLLASRYVLEYRSISIALGNGANHRALHHEPQSSYTYWKETSTTSVVVYFSMLLNQSCNCFIQIRISEKISSENGATAIVLGFVTLLTAWLRALPTRFSMKFIIRRENKE